MSKRIDNTACHCLKMRRSAENVVRFYDSVLAPSGITVRQYSLLKAISENIGCSIRVLSDAALLDRSTLARSLKPLIHSGYITDKRAANARDCALELTDSGLSVCREAAGLWEKAQQQYEEKLGWEQLSALENALEMLQEL